MIAPLNGFDVTRNVKGRGRVNRPMLFICRIICLDFSALLIRSLGIPEFMSRRIYSRSLDVAKRKSVLTLIRCRSVLGGTRFLCWSININFGPISNSRPTLALLWIMGKCIFYLAIRIVTYIGGLKSFSKCRLCTSFSYFTLLFINLALDSLS